MTSIARVSRSLSTVFEHDAVELGKQYGLRQRTMTFTQLAYVLVLGWWKQPAAGPSALTRFAGSLGVRLCKQDLDCHWTERTADWLLALLRRAITRVVCAKAVGLPLLQQFTAVLLEDGSSISLPSVLKRVWGGCGGSLSQQGVFFLMRYKAGIVLWLANERLDLLAVLPQVQGQRLDILVDMGASKLLTGVRLLAERVPAPVAAQRQERMRQYASAHGKPVNALLVELANWTIVVTNVPLSRLTCEQALALLRARWQIELLFKLWKEHGLLDDWNATNPWRILCEVYAKLLAMVVQHWFLLLSCWDDPHRSLSAVAQVLREQVPTLVHGLTGHLPLGRAIRLIVQSVGGGCSIPNRSTRLSTSRRLQCAWESGLT